MSGQYIDISSFQPENINYGLYVPWSKQGDGIARICLRVDQGVSTPDALFQAHYDKAKAAGVEQVIFYHFCYPWLHPLWAGAEAEAKAFVQYLGNRLGPEDYVMLDAEAFQNNSGPADWHWDWLYMVANMLHIPNSRVALYSNPNYIANHLQDSRLAQFPLILADWTFNPTSKPAAPKPWSSYIALQWTDKGTVPGVPEAVDVNTFELAPPAPPAPPPPPSPDLAKIKADAEAAAASVADILKALGG